MGKIKFNGCTFLIGFLGFAIVLAWVTGGFKRKPSDGSTPVRSVSPESREQSRLADVKQRLPQLYAQATADVKAGKYPIAFYELDDIAKADPTFKEAEVQALLRTTRTKAADQMAAEAAKQTKSDSCSTVRNAITLYESAMKTDPSREKKFSAGLKRAQTELLKCPEGNDELLMSIDIVKRSRVALYVTITNSSNRVRHANPNFFTLTTESGESLSYSTGTFEYEKPFGAVQLQPGTSTGGMITFDTSAAPRRLIYSESLGTSISREFPN